ncbi:MAG TPA: hypothetical protein VGL11_11585, partial [Candidatus Binatia bacterium]
MVEDDHAPAAARLRLAIFFLLVASLFLEAEGQCAAPSEWEQIIAKARQERRVVLGTDVSVAGFRQGITGSFAKQFGFDMEFRVLEGAQLVAVAA